MATLKTVKKIEILDFNYYTKINSKLLLEDGIHLAENISIVRMKKGAKWGLHADNHDFLKLREASKNLKDDEKEILDPLKEMLLSEGYHVTPFLNPQRALEFLNKNLTIDDVLDRILEVGVENITIFEKFYLDQNIEIRKK